MSELEKAVEESLVTPEGTVHCFYSVNQWQQFQ